MASAAALMLIRQLGPGDRAAIVPFHGHVDGPTGLLRMDEAGKLAAEGKVVSLGATGGVGAGGGGGRAKFLPALMYASDLLSGRGSDDVACRPGFVLFLSDGEDGSVLTPHADALIGKEYPVDTVGLLCHNWSCNPESMVHISKHTGGTYHPIDDGKSSSIKLAVGSFLRGILSAVAAGALVELRVPQGSGVRIAEVQYSGSSVVAQDGKSATVGAGALYSGEEREFVVRLDIPAGAEAKEHVLTVGGQYNRPTAGKPEPMSMEEKRVEITRYGGVNGSISKPAPPPKAITTGCGGLTYSQLLVVEMVRARVVGMVTSVVEKFKDDGAGAARPEQRKIAEELELRWEELRSSSAMGAVVQQLWWARAGTTTTTTTTEEWQQYVARVVEEQIQGLRRMLICREEEGHHVGVVHHLHSWVASQVAQRPTSTAADVEAWWSSSVQEAPAVTASGDGDPCRCCVYLDRIEERLSVWSKHKRELPCLLQPSEDAETYHLTAVSREASLEAINRAMHHDIYLAVVHARNLRRCYDSAGKRHDDDNCH